MTTEAETTISIEGIFTCALGSEDMTSLQTANLIEGVGLEGDRYAQGIGTYSVLKEPGRQLTLISADGVEAALQATNLLAQHDAEKESSFSVGKLRRNIVLRGISSAALLAAIGSIVQLGDGGAKVFVHRNCVPCMYNERRNQLPGLMEAFWETAGVSCEVIASGSVAVGNAVTIHPQTSAPGTPGHRVATDGGKPKGFFIRPKLRSAEMVRHMLEGKKKSRAALMETDKEGLLRMQQSFESVGLKF